MEISKISKDFQVYDFYTHNFYAQDILALGYDYLFLLPYF